MSDNSYLKQRRLGWYVQLAVPTALQAVVGSKVLTRSLKTRDIAEARRLRHAVIAELQEQLGKAAALPAGSPLVTTAEVLRESFLSGESTEHDAEAALDAAVDSHLAKRRGELSPAEVGTVRKAHAIVAGRIDATLSHLATRYLREVEAEGVLQASTIGEKRRRLEHFCEWFGRDREWSEVRRRDAVDYLANLRTVAKQKGSRDRLSRTTLVKWLSDLRVLFRWILDREDADTRPANPFDGLQPARDVRGTESARRPWEAAELRALLHGIPAEDPLWSLSALAAYSGARLNELASLRVEDVEGSSFLIRAGKRQASVRRVPVHPTVSPLVKRLAASSSDGFLIPGLLSGGSDDKRGHLIGKRFGHKKQSLGLDDPRLVFHSFRNTVETQMIARGVPLERAQMIVGHVVLGSSAPYVARGSVQDRENRAALSKVSYGKKLDDYVRETGAEVAVASKARRRPKRG